MAEQVRPKAKAKAKAKETEDTKAGGKTPHPSIGNPDSSVYPFPTPKLPTDEQGNITEWRCGAPADYDPKTHAPLRKKDFQAEWQYYEWRRQKLQAQADEQANLRDEARELGSKSDKANARRLATLYKRMQEIRQKLQADGLDADAVLRKEGIDPDALS